MSEIEVMTKRAYEKEQRVKKANQAIEVIAAYGRKFFKHGDNISRLELDRRGRVWFVDGYTGKRIYTHYTTGRWRGFSEGGTLRALVIAFREYITTGNPLPPGHLGPWPAWYSEGDPWGYGPDMQEVIRKVADLGLTVS